MFVVPMDAAPLLARKVLDERLFDITELRGYGGKLPVIVKYTSQQRPFATTAGTVDLPSINGAAFTADPATFWPGFTGTRLAGSAIAKVWLDGKRTATLDHSVPQIGAPTAWQAGYTGTGITVAVLDTGVDQTHPDLADREVGERNFSGSPDSGDHYGHGTHVASIIAGTGAKSGGKYRGVAPGARILDVKVLQDNGSGADSGILAGMQWAAEQGAAIVNMSLGGYDTPEIDPIEEAVNSLSAKYGTLFVIAAGNSGPRPGSISSPGSADAALTVGAVDRDNQIADFSSRGPRLGGGVIKPDITAPGVDIVAARHADGRIGEPVGDGYTKLSGTSMATPHVAGAAALVAQQHPGFTGEQLKSLLIGASTPTTGLTPFEQGAGRVDSAKVLTQTVTAQPNSLSFGQHQWPHTNKPVLTKEITYTNAGSAPVTLDLRVDGTLFTVSPAQIVVPAGGQASAVVKADESSAPNGGKFGGAVVATGGGSSVRTAVEVDLEVESYDLTLTVHDRTGGVPGYASVFLTNLDTGEGIFPKEFVDGKATQRLPIGHYLMSGSVMGGETFTYDMLSYPNLTITGPATIDVDARLAKPLNVRLPVADARLSLLEVAFERISGPNRYTIGGISRGGDVSDLGFGQLGPDAPPNEVTGQVATNWVAPNGDLYNLAWYRKGGVFTGLDKDVRAGDLAKVSVDLGPVAKDAPIYVGNTSSPHNKRNDWGLGALTAVKPGIHTEYFGGEDSDWARRLSLPGENYEVFDGPPKSYTPGKSYKESWHRGVFGPALPDTRDDLWVQQRGDLMVIAIPLFGDSAGNAGFSATESATTSLYRNDQLFGTVPEPGVGRFVIPAGKAKYRVSTEATRTGQKLTTKVAGTWTFTGDRSSGVVQHPVSVVRFTPKLDDAGSAPAGSLFVVPVTVQNQAGTSSKQRLGSVHVSYDRGTTWQNVPVFGDFALLYHPASAKSVSFRATAEDHSGNSVDQTIIDAYLLH